MASRPADTTSPANSRPSNSATMDLLGSSPSGVASRPAAVPSPPAGSSLPSAPRPSRESLSAAVRSPPARLSNPAPSRLPASSSINRNVAAAARPSSASSASVAASRQDNPPSSASSVPNSSAPPSAAVPSPISASTASVSCKNGSDCVSNICIAGFCQTSSGFAVSVSGASAAASSAPNHHGHKDGHHKGTPTACSDPRCTLPAAITSLNGAEEKDISASLGSHQRAVSSAATAGIVLALLFATLAILLIVPKIRDWAKKCFGCTKDDNGIVLEDEGSPEFGNHHASAFMSAEKRRTTLNTVSNGSLKDRSMYGNSYREQDEYLPGYEGGQGDIADVKVDLKQDDGYFGEYNGYHSHHHTTTTAGHQAPVLPALDYGNSQSNRDLASYVEHHPAPPMPLQAPMPVTRTQPAPAQFVPPASKPGNITPWAGRDAQVRETVLPYTVEEDRDVLIGLKNLGTPAVDDSQSSHTFSNTRDAYTTPIMHQRGFDGSLASPQTPITPGSAYSVRTQLLPASLRPGQGQGAVGRAPILKQGLMASRPTFKRLSNALRFDSSVKPS